MYFGFSKYSQGTGWRINRTLPEFRFISKITFKITLIHSAAAFIQTDLRQSDLHKGVSLTHLCLSVAFWFLQISRHALIHRTTVKFKMTLVHLKVLVLCHIKVQGNMFPYMDSACTCILIIMMAKASSFCVHLCFQYQ